MNSVRTEKINAELQKQISHIIATKIRDPQIDAMISVVDVQTTPDLEHAKVFISSIGKTPKEEVLARIKGAGGFIRKEVSKSVKLRITPRLEFYLDTTMEYANKIDNILKGITYSTKPDEDEENN